MYNYCNGMEEIVMELFDLISGTLANDEKASTHSVEKADTDLTFKRGEDGVLWSYDSAGNKVGRIFEHGDNDNIDEIEEV